MRLTDRKLDKILEYNCLEEQEIFDGQLDSHQTMYIWNSHNSKQNDTLTWWGEASM